MKGLLYSFMVQKKHFFIWTAALSVLVAVLGCITLTLAENTHDDETLQSLLALGNGFFVGFGPILSTLLAGEGINRQIESDLKSGFHNSTLAGMSTLRYCNVNLALNLFCFGFVMVTVALQWACFALTDSTVVDFSLISIQFAVLVFEFAINWLCIPLTMVLKSQEKAGLIMGLAIAFPLMVPICMAMDGTINVIPWFENPLSLLVSLAVGAALFAVGYLMLYNTVKRGDLC